MQDSSGIDRALPEPPRQRSGSSRATVPGITLIAFACLLWLINWVPIQAPTYVFLGNAVATQSRWHQLVLLSRTQGIDSEKIQWLDCVPAVDSQLGSPTSELKVLKIRVGLRKTGDAPFVEREIERLTRPSSNLEATGPLRTSLREQRWRVEVVNHQIQRFRLDCDREGIAMSDATAAGTFRLASHPKRIVPGNPSSQEHETADGNSGSERRKLTDADRSTWNRLTEMKAIHEGNVRRLEEELEQVVAVSSGHFALTGAPRVSALPGKFSWVRSMFAILLATSVAVGLTFGSPRILRRSGRWLWTLPANTNRFFRRVQHPSEVPYDESEIARALEQHSIAYWGVLAHQNLENDVLRSSTETFQTNTIPTPEMENQNEAQRRVIDVDSRDPRLSLEHVARINRFNRYWLFTADGPAIGDMLLVAWLCIFVLRYGVDSVWRELLFKAPLAAFSSVLFGI